MSATRSCQGCDGHGQVLLMNSWFTQDGYRRERCAICNGTGINPKNYQDWGGGLAFQRRALARTAEWGRLAPSPAAPASRKGGDHG